MGFGGPELAFLFILPVMACACAFWIWMLVECLAKEADTGNTRIAWLLAILLAHIVGALIYYFVRRPQRYAELGR
jgi:Phospholipase_D-nuclease N-terminal